MNVLVTRKQEHSWKPDEQYGDHRVVQPGAVPGAVRPPPAAGLGELGGPGRDLRGDAARPAPLQRARAGRPPARRGRLKSSGRAAGPWPLQHSGGRGEPGMEYPRTGGRGFPILAPRRGAGTIPLLTGRRAAGVLDAVQGPGPAPLARAGHPRHALHRADAGPGRGHPRRPRRPRPDRHRPDRHRQDRRLPAADPAPPPRPAARHDAAPSSSRPRASWPSRSTTSASGWPTTRRCASASLVGGAADGAAGEGPAGRRRTASSPRPAGCSTTCGRTRPASTRSTPSSSTRPTACSTWASCPDLKRIVARLPARKQTLLFSATMPPVIAKLAARDPARPADDPDRPAQRPGGRHHPGRLPGRRAPQDGAAAPPAAATPRCRRCWCSRAPSSRRSGWRGSSPPTASRWPSCTAT